MHRISRSLMIPVAVAAAGLGIVTPRLAHADGPAQAVVEASQDFCVNPSISCVDFAHAYNIGYEEVALTNFENLPYATPDTAVFVCVKGYMGPDGPHLLTGHVFAGYDPGSSIQGKMYIYNSATETTTRAYSSLNVAAQDPYMGTSAVARGTQITNNVSDTPLGGLINLRITGNLEDIDLGEAGPDAVHAALSTQGIHTNATVYGSISCSIHLPYVIQPSELNGQPPDSEAVISDTDGD